MTKLNLFQPLARQMLSLIELHRFPEANTDVLAQGQVFFNNGLIETMYFFRTGELRTPFEFILAFVKNRILKLVIEKTRIHLGILCLMEVIEKMKPLAPGFGQSKTYQCLTLLCECAYRASKGVKQNQQVRSCLYFSRQAMERWTKEEENLFDFCANGDVEHQVFGHVYKEMTEVLSASNNKWAKSIIHFLFLPEGKFFPLEYGPIIDKAYVLLAYLARNG